ncbi:MAG: tetratricopeptide repeat protein [Ignavibacteriales bacterium]|nr:tetratricopeptide repeat protein [Ignavibacteriales bacterium]
MSKKSARNKRKNIEASRMNARKKLLVGNRKEIVIYLLSIIGIISLSLIVYSNTLQSGFQYDDNGSIINNLDLRHLSNFTDISKWTRLTNSRSFSYLTFALNYHWSELNVYGYHVVNSIIHTLTALSVFWLLLLTFKTPVMRSEEVSKYSKYIALFGALIFVAHPIQTNAITYIVQRMTSMATMFYILSLCLYVQGRMIQIEGKRKVLSLVFYLGAVIGFVLGMWSKEIVYSLPGALIMYELFFIRDKENKIYWRYIIAALTIIVIAFLKIFSGGLPRETIQISRLDYLMTQFRVLVTYIRLLFIPINQNLDYDFPLSKTLWDFATMGSLLLLIGIIIGGIYSFKKYRLLSFGIFWFFLTLSIESSIFPITDVIFEHRLYLPMFGYVLFLVSSFYYFVLRKTSHRFVGISLLIIVSSYSYAAYSRNEVWKTEVSFMTDIIEKSPNKPRPYYGRAKILIDQRRYDEAIADCNMAIKIKHDCAEAYNNRGMVYALLGKDLNMAKADLDSALKFNPIYPDAMVNLANVYCLMKNYDSALVKFDRLLQLFPTAMGGYNGRGVCYLNTMRYDSAIANFNEGMKITPNNSTLWYNRGLAYARKGMPIDAINDYSRSLALNPNAGDVYLDRAISYQNIGQPVKAWEDVQRSIALGHKVPPQIIEQYKNILLKAKK